ncbi:unnamed protein product [Arabis nemorensis]|uniref:Uncharacterized protein n=1 Tax=Arabis nemorensis TaxID=586526 RepID=A0A565BMI6_9BRAS|nr:unnamed protein product [Arabis nemorensis]
MGNSTLVGWVGSSCAMYDIDLIYEKIPVILDDSKTWHIVLSTSMNEVGRRGNCISEIRS